MLTYENNDDSVAYLQSKEKKTSLIDASESRSFLSKFLS